MTEHPSSMAEMVASSRRQLSGPGTLFEVVEEDVRGNRLPVFRHRARSLIELLDRSARFGDRQYLVDGDVRLDFRSHRAAVDAFAAHLQRDHGVGPGDRVAIASANRWEWVVAFWATAAVGAIPAAFNGWWTAEELRSAADLVSPVLVLGDGPRLARVAEAGIAAPTVDLDTVADVVNRLAGQRPEGVAVGEDDPALLLFTSGTTGRAKAACLSHRALVGFVQVNQFSEALGLVAAGQPVPAAGDELPPSDLVVLVTSPLFHVSMLQGVILQAVVNGSSFVLLPGRFDPERVLAAIEKERVTRWLALGSAAPRLVASPAVGRYDTSSLRHVGVGGAPVSPAVQEALRDAFPSARSSLSMGYSSTEAGAVIANIAGPELLAHPTSTGRANVTTEIELRDADGQPVPEGQLGEVHVRSAYLMLGYWDDPAASAAVLKDGGWLALGDMARFEGDLLHIDSRARDMILVSAENVSPTEVEYCLEAHPAVQEAAVIAVDDDVTGDAVCAIVHVDDASDVGVDELTDWCRRELAHYKVPTRWHVLTEALPRTASGKLLKHELRARIEAGGLAAPPAEASG